MARSSDSCSLVVMPAALLTYSFCCLPLTVTVFSTVSP